MKECSIRSFFDFIYKIRTTMRALCALILFGHFNEEITNITNQACNLCKWHVSQNYIFVNPCVNINANSIFWTLSYIYNETLFRKTLTAKIFSNRSIRDFNRVLSKTMTLRKKCPYSEFFWSVFSRIRIEYGEIRSTDTFHTVWSYAGSSWGKS